MKTITKYWGRDQCKKSDDRGIHWAYYTFENEADEKYWTTEHKDDTNKAYWRHYDFMSIPCHYCGGFSPLRCSDAFLSGGDVSGLSCKKEDIVNYRPNDILPDALAYYRENGWSYIYFKETLSDSLSGQETFRLKCLPEVES